MNHPPECPRRILREAARALQLAGAGACERRGGAGHNLRTRLAGIRVRARPYAALFCWTDVSMFETRSPTRSPN
jgi:hypothetical protein